MFVKLVPLAAQLVFFVVQYMNWETWHMKNRTIKFSADLQGFTVEGQEAGISDERFIIAARENLGYAAMFIVSGTSLAIQLYLFI